MQTTPDEIFIPSYRQQGKALGGTSSVEPTYPSKAPKANRLLFWCVDFAELEVGRYVPEVLETVQ